MRKGLLNPNSIAAIKELRLEIANELSITDFKEIEEYKGKNQDAEINKRLAERARLNLIGFK